jgi:hypothetical protein
MNDHDYGDDQIATNRFDRNDVGYWCFTREQLDQLLAGLEDRAAAIVLQALDSPDARRLGLHHMARFRAR